MRLTMTVRNPKTNAVSTFVDEFQGENVAERLLAVITSRVSRWVIADGNEIIVLHVH